MRIKLNNTRAMTGGKSVYIGGNKVRSFITTFLIVLFIASGFFLLTWKEIYGMRLGYDIQKKQEEVKEFLDKNQILKMKLMNLSSLEKVENKAIEKMELKKPNLNQIKIVE